MDQYAGCGSGVVVRVLVVDDDADIAAMLALMVTKLGHHGEACSEPTEAIEHHALGLLSGRYDLIICDYMMSPNGVAVLEEFIASGAYRVLLTGSYMSAELQRALVLGVAHEVIQKPLSLVELSRVLDRASVMAR